MAGAGRGVWRRIFSAPDPDDDGLIAVVDYKTGRVVRIPGEFPWPERLHRNRIRIAVAIACLLLVAVGVATATESAADCAAPLKPWDNTMPVGTATDTLT